MVLLSTFWEKLIRPDYRLVNRPSTITAASNGKQRIWRRSLLRGCIVTGGKEEWVGLCLVSCLGERGKPTPNVSFFFLSFPSYRLQQPLCGSGGIGWYRYTFPATVQPTPSSLHPLSLASPFRPYSHGGGGGGRGGGGESRKLYGDSL